MSFAHSLSHVFVPQESNNYKSRLLHTPVLVLVLLGVIVLQNFLSLAPKLGIDVLGYAANISPMEVVRLTNEERAVNGISALTVNQALTEAAREKGEHMLAHNYWAHVSPEGVEPWYFFGQVGYNYKYAGENLARDFSNPKDAVDAWMASPSHRENLLSSKYKDIGIAVVEGKIDGVDTTIIVQLFGSTSADTLPAVPVAAASENEPLKPLPTVEPSEVQAPVQIAGTDEMVSGEKISNVTGKPSPFDVTKLFSMGLVFLIATTIVIDALVVENRGVSRVSGRSFAHLSFMLMVGAIILIAKSGTIF